ncbi:hypothetical protein MKK69_13550 [Methylobacterium sp. J-026]|uniref:hypothetical protein n=1 Tax=Methylobacterium sp. J-026 TaxID=2836624 RepID=UPI001FB957E2|nr:hypothetical protein [Methylobacterium sp. J-026]MCJ2135071.1 hypothetical protein [Methylobacterium sp. J-026]
MDDFGTATPGGSADLSEFGVQDAAGPGGNRCGRAHEPATIHGLIGVGRLKF